MITFTLSIIAFLSVTHWIRWVAYKIYLSPETTSLGPNHVGKYAKFQARIYLATILDLLMLAGVLAVFPVRKMAEASAHPGWVLAFWAGVPLLLFGFFEIYRFRFEKRHNIPHLMHEPRYKR